MISTRWMCHKPEFLLPEILYPSEGGWVKKVKAINIYEIGQIPPDWFHCTKNPDVLERKPGVPKVGLNARHSKCHQLIAILDDTPSRERMNLTGNFKGLSNDRRTEGLNHDYHHTISQLCDTIKMDSIHISCADDMAFVAATTLVVYIHFPFWPRICYFLLEL